VRVERSLHLEFAVRIGVVMDARFMVGEADSGRAEGTYDPRGDADGSEDESCGRHFVVFGDVGVQRQIRARRREGSCSCRLLSGVERSRSPAETLDVILESSSNLFI
jgi:hypothetical protein